MERQSKFTFMMALHFLGMQVEKRGLLSRRKVVRMGPLISVGGFLFETGAVLGRVMRDQLPTFVYPFCSETPDNVALADLMRRKGREVASRGEGASTISELVTISEMRKVDATLPADQWAMWMLANGNGELAVEFAGQMGIMFMVDGAGFGAEFPDRFEQLYFNTYAKVDRDAWNEMREHGLDIPAEPDEFVPLEVRTENDLAIFADYCAEFYPDYVAKLGLQQYVGRSD